MGETYILTTFARFKKENPLKETIRPENFERIQDTNTLKELAE
jgi:hypothetical protein